MEGHRPVILLIIELYASNYIKNTWKGIRVETLQK